ncbi:replication protein [Alcaligenes endophyticus]|uniref:Replication protein n=1 Tax=Alcaligenes endophyticus TaxID=1929088 RepID=A0ABT8EJ05_9BURK|nr:replication protein [Alcaligenes endophyticus]MCX5592511.1 replication protein [Alcaligenes endophyticus]MDN4121237.1 replication protein [Alcaligenes endophyticus]
MNTARVIQMEDKALPQLENGFLRIANELFDAVLGFGFTSKQIHVLLAVIRKTYGYGKSADDVSASQLGELCGMGRSHVTSTLNQLAEMKVINKQPGIYGSIVSVNKNYHAWVKAEDLVNASTKSEQVSRNGSSTESGQGVPKRVFDSTESEQVDSTESGHTKDNLPKDNKQKTCASAESFVQFWSAYPKKRSKGAAEKAFLKINPDEQLLADMLRGIQRAMTQENWKKAKGQFIPYPATWLNAKGWEDEIDDLQGEGSGADDLFEGAL